jgi:hypothetical protein
MTTNTATLIDLARSQGGQLTMQQAKAAGLTPRVISELVDQGIIAYDGVRLVTATWVDRDELSRLRGLVLDIGPDVWVSGPTAAAIYGMDGFSLQRPFHVTTKRDRGIRRARHRIHTTKALPAIDTKSLDGLPVTSAARTLIDLAANRRISRPRLTAALDSAMRDRMTSETQLHRRIAVLRSQGRYGIPRLLEILEGDEISRGGHSWLEREFLRLLGRHGLPKPLTQQVLARTGDRLVRVDCRFADSPVVVELLGYRWHRTRDQMESDTRRMNALLLAGFVPLQFTYQQVVSRPNEVLTALRHAL